MILPRENRMKVELQVNMWKKIGFAWMRSIFVRCRKWVYTVVWAFHSLYQFILNFKCHALTNMTITDINYPIRPYYDCSESWPRMYWKPHTGFQNFFWSLQWFYNHCVTYACAHLYFYSVYICTFKNQRCCSYTPFQMKWANAKEGYTTRICYHNIWAL